MRHKSLVPWLIALACFGPFGLALLLYYGPWGAEWLPRLPGSRELLDPPVPVPSEWREPGAAAYPWLLIYAKMTPCERQCEHDLGRLSQVQLALGRDQDRVQRAFWYAGDRPIVDDPQLSLKRLDAGAGRNLTQALGGDRLAEGRVYVADPFGSLILSYPVDVEQKELLRDLKRLLSVSGKGS